MNYILFFLLLIFNYECFSQTIISGNVKNKVTSDPIPYASVGVEGTTIGAFCNEVGVFTFEIPSNSNVNSLKITCVGFEEKIIDLANAKGDILLNPLNQNLEEVVISSNIKILGELTSRWWTTATILSKSADAMYQGTYNQRQPLNAVFLSTTHFEPNDSLFIQGATYLTRLVGVGRLFEWGKRSGRINNISFWLFPSGVSNLKLQLNIIDAKTFKTFLQKPLYFEWNAKKDSLFNFDLSNQQIYVNRDFITTVEVIDGTPTLSPHRSILATFSLYGVPKNSNDALFKMGVQDKWYRTKGFAPAIEVKIRY